MILQAREIELVTRCHALTLAKCPASTGVTYFQSKAAGKILEFSARHCHSGKEEVLKWIFGRFVTVLLLGARNQTSQSQQKEKPSAVAFFAAVASAICVSNVWPPHKTVLSSSLAFSHFTYVAFTVPLFKVLCFRETLAVNLSSWNPKC